MNVSSRHLAHHVGVADRHRGRLVGIGQVAQRTFDEEIHDGDADIGQQQRRDGLVDAARVAQVAGKADPQRTRQRAHRRHHD